MPNAMLLLAEFLAPSNVVNIIHGTKNLHSVLDLVFSDH